MKEHIIFKGHVYKNISSGYIELLSDKGEFFDAYYCHFNFFATGNSPIWNKPYVELILKTEYKEIIVFKGRTAYGYKFIDQDGYVSGGYESDKIHTTSEAKFFDKIFKTHFNKHVELIARYKEKI